MHHNCDSQQFLDFFVIALDFFALLTDIIPANECWLKCAQSHVVREQSLTLSRPTSLFGRTDLPSLLVYVTGKQKSVITCIREFNLVS